MDQLTDDVRFVITKTKLIDVEADVAAIENADAFVPEPGGGIEVGELRYGRTWKTRTGRNFYRDRSSDANGSGGNSEAGPI